MLHTLFLQFSCCVLTQCSALKDFYFISAASINISCSPEGEHSRCHARKTESIPRCDATISRYNVKTSHYKLETTRCNARTSPYDAKTSYYVKICLVIVRFTLFLVWEQNASVRIWKTAHSEANWRRWWTWLLWQVVNVEAFGTEPLHSDFGSASAHQGRVWLAALRMTKTWTALTTASRRCFRVEFSSRSFHDFMSLFLLNVTQLGRGVAVLILGAFTLRA